MAHYISLNVKLSKSQLNELKSAIKKNETEVVLRVSLNILGHSVDETNFPHKLLLTNRQVAYYHKPFANNSSVRIKLSKTQLSIVVQLVGFVGRRLAPLIRTG